MAAAWTQGCGAECPSCLPQGQFLCLAIRDGKLVLYYDFSTGLEMAKPSSNSSSLTISSTTNKAVRAWGAPQPEGRWDTQTLVLGGVSGTCKMFFDYRAMNQTPCAALCDGPNWSAGSFFFCLQIQIFLLKMNNKKRILVRLERLTIFMVEQENSLENAVSYYLGGVPPAVLPPRWVQPAVGWDSPNLPFWWPWGQPWSLPSHIPGMFGPRWSWGKDFLFLPIAVSF